MSNVCTLCFLQVDHPSAVLTDDKHTRNYLRTFVKEVFPSVMEKPWALVSGRPGLSLILATSGSESSDTPLAGSIAEQLRPARGAATFLSRGACCSVSVTSSARWQ